MEHTINALNTEIGVFLRFMRGYINGNDVNISKKTGDLLDELLECLDELGSRANAVDIPNESNVDFLAGLDEQNFELRRNIMCRSCIEPIVVSKDEYDAHVRKSSHLFRMQQKYTHLHPCSSDFPSLNSVDSKPNDVKKSDVSPSLGNRSTNNTNEASKPSKYSSKYSSQFKNIFKKTYDSVPTASEHHQTQEPDASQPNENIWKQFDDTSDSDSSVHGFNFDSKYLIEVKGLPRSATRQEISQLFGNNILNGLNGIHFTFGAKIVKNGHAYIQLEGIKDFQTALKQPKTMDDRVIEVKAADLKGFNDLVANRQIPSKESVVVLEGVPYEFSEQDVRLLFHGLSIEKIQMVQDGTNGPTVAAFAKFLNIGDVEVAIKRSDKEKKILVSRSTDLQMQLAKSGKMTFIRKSPEKPIAEQNTTVKNPHRLGATQSSCKFFLKVEGLPMVDEAFVANLFPGLSIDQSKGIQMQNEAKNRCTAFVAFNDAYDYGLAVRIDLSKFSKQIKVSPAKAGEFTLAKIKNESASK